MNSASTHAAARPWLKRGSAPVGWCFSLAVFRKAMNSVVTRPSSGRMVSWARSSVVPAMAAPSNYGGAGIQPYSRTPCDDQIGLHRDTLSKLAVARLELLWLETARPICTVDPRLIVTLPTVVHDEPFEEAEAVMVLPERTILTQYGAVADGPAMFAADPPAVVRY